MNNPERYLHKNMVNSHYNQMEIDDFFATLKLVNKKRNDLFGCYTFGDCGWQIMILIRSSDTLLTAEELTLELGLQAGTVNRWLDILTKLELITTKSSFDKVVYDLSERGSERMSEIFEPFFVASTINN